MIEPIRIRDFGEGLWANRAALLVPEGAAANVRSFVMTHGALEIRPGRTVHSEVPTGVTTVARLISQMVPSSGYVRLVACYGTAVYATKDAGQTFESAYDTPALNPALHATNPLRAVQAGDVWLLVDGSNRVRSFTGSVFTCTLLVPAVVPPTTPHTVVVSSAGATDTLLAGDYELAIAFDDGETSSPFGATTTNTLTSDGKKLIFVKIPTANKTQAGTLSMTHISLYGRTPYSPIGKWIRLAHLAMTPGTYWPAAGNAELELHAGAVAWAGYVVTAGSWAMGGGGVATLTIGAHALVVGAHITVASVASAGPGAYNGSNLEITVVSATQISYALAADPGAWTSGGLVTLPLNMQIDADLPEMANVLDSPPAGVALIANWGARTIYTFRYPGVATGPKDTLWLSNLGDPTKVPIEVNPDAPTTYGGCIQLGVDGQEITAIGVIGDILVGFKKLGIWAVTGDSWSNWSWPQVNFERGTASQEDICVTDAGIYFRDRGTVWFLDGQMKPQPVGEQIRDVLGSLGTSGRTVYDAQLERLELFLGVS